ncbi:HEAT repeat domain-containing protein [Gemmata obscuriglobus]|uniref:HEAT repeat domain-containing protein n=1 Tax=Gemmata obscuriglobus TaxID=114 RepID=UPI0011CE077C|nr:HEAT repeat domain-containing protein [Gemmata obscuriglobus]
MSFMFGTQRASVVGLVDWHALAQKLGTLRDGGESGGSDLGRQALELIVGVDSLRSAVDYYVAGAPGSELARSVLALLKPLSAMERCLEIARSEADAESRRSAVELLRMVADGRGIAWAAEFLGDEDEGVQVWGAGIVDQLLWSGLADPEDCGQILEAMATHPNVGVQRQAAFVRSFLASRQKAAEPGAAPDTAI